MILHYTNLNFRSKFKVQWYLDNLGKVIEVNALLSSFFLLPHEPTEGSRIYLYISYDNFVLRVAGEGVGGSGQGLVAKSNGLLEIAVWVPLSERARSRDMTAPALPLPVTPSVCTVQKLLISGCKGC